jgi:hypothetical protein
MRAIRSSSSDMQALHQAKGSPKSANFASCPKPAGTTEKDSRAFSTSKPFAAAVLHQFAADPCTATD